MLLLFIFWLLLLELLNGTWLLLLLLSLKKLLIWLFWLGFCWEGCPINCWGWYWELSLLLSLLLSPLPFGPLKFDDGLLFCPTSLTFWPTPVFSWSYTIDFEIDGFKLISLSLIPSWFRFRFWFWFFCSSNSRSSILSSGLLFP